MRSQMLKTPVRLKPVCAAVTANEHPAARKATTRCLRRRHLADFEALLPRRIGVDPA